MHDDHPLVAAADLGQDRVAVQGQPADLARELTPQDGGELPVRAGGQRGVGPEAQRVVVLGDGDPGCDVSCPTFSGQAICD